MFTTQQRIQIIVEAIDKTKGGFVPVRRRIEEIRHGLSGLTKETTTEVRAVDLLAERYARQLGLRQEAVRSLLMEIASRKTIIDLIHEATGISKKEIETWGSKKEILNRFIPIQKQVTMGLQRFKMEMLSVMFFGMGMYHMFMSWLRPAMESYGIFEMFGTMLEDLFLPVIEAIYPFFEGITEWFMGLPESVKLAIGVLVLIGVVFGGLLMILGMVVLGLSGLAMIGMKFVAVIAIISAVVTAIILVFSNWGMIVEWLKGVWQGFTDFLSGVWNSLLSLAGTVFDGIFGHIAHAWTQTDSETNTVWDKVKSFLTNTWDSISNKISTVCSDIFNAIKDKWNEILDKIKTILGDIWDAIKEKWDSILQHIKDICQGIYDSVTKFFGDIVDWIYDWGKDFVSNMVDGLKATGSKVADALWDLIPEPFKSAIQTGKKIVLDIVETITGRRTKQVRTYQYGGVVPGRLGEPVPIIAHGGERFLGIRGGGYGFGGVIYFNPTYYVYVSDKAEFESMLKENNEKIVEELRRMIGG